MADISRFLQDILDAIYGEQVRGSIHDAIELINDVSEVILTTGTDITAPTDSSEGYYTGSLYLNLDTYELWKCVGTNAWQSLGILKGATGNGIDNITKTSTSGLVDTYTITYTDGTSDTFDITNGEDGDNGNRWYRGTAISGKAVLPTVYPTGIADANANDFYLNPSEGAIYHCVTGGDDTTATWSYDFTMTGGGGGGSIVTWTQIQGSTGGVKIAEIDIDGSVQEVYVPEGGGGGMLPYLYIDSEAGATVTVIQPDSTTITPTAAGSGHWECELTGGYGTYVIHSVLSGQGDATLSLVVDTVKEYHVTDTHYDHTVSFVAPSGSTVRIEGGTEIYTLTGTGSTQTQAVHSASTSFTVTATMDGNGKPYTFTTPSTTGQTTTIPSGTFDFGTINVSVAADFVTAGSTITCAKTGVNTISKAAASTLTFRIPETGEYTISGTIGSDTYEVKANVTVLGTPVPCELVTIVKAPMYPFETATDAQLAAMLESYYNGAYDATDIATLKSTYLPIGAKRTIYLSAMEATNVSESHNAGSYKFVIIDHEHDNLTTPINGKTKALLTLNQERILYKNTTDETYSSNYPTAANEGGYINPTDSNEGGWNNCARRAWCNDVYYNALPSSIKSLVKSVDKLSSEGQGSSVMIASADKAFLLAEIELFGTVTNSVVGEGSQYSYFATETNRYKKPYYTTNLSALYWMRSPHKSTTSYSSFCSTTSGAVASSGAASSTRGIAPAICL